MWIRIGSSLTTRYRCCNGGGLKLPGEWGTSKQLADEVNASLIIPLELPIPPFVICSKGD